MLLSPDALAIDAATVATDLVEGLRDTVHGRLQKRGAVVAISGGVDSTVVAALCARAFGSERTLALSLPEIESDAETERLSNLAASTLDVPLVVEDITGVLEAAGCYRRRDEAIRRVLPEYGRGWRAKLTLPSLIGAQGLRLFSVVAESPEGRRVSARLNAEAYLEVVAATSFKQRTRKMFEYYHADRLNYAVVGTANRLEHDQGFFVKNGDGAADVKPIARLYKSQVYQLAEYLQLPEEIRTQQPSTDTYPLAQTQEEFYFSVPYETLDLCLYARDNQIGADAVAELLGLTVDDVERIFVDIDRKRRATAYLHLQPQLLSSAGGD